MFHFPSVPHFFSSQTKLKGQIKSEMYKLFHIIYRAPLQVKVGESGDKNIT